MFYTVFAHMSDCMYHCEKLGGRAPNVATEDQWNEFQSFMMQNYYDKDDNAMLGPWLSVSDFENEGKWKDFYSGAVSYTHLTLPTKRIV